MRKYLPPIFGAITYNITILLIMNLFMFNTVLEKSSLNDARVKDFGPGNYQLTKTDISYIAYGACFLGSGGGGSIGLALLFIDKMLNDADTMTYINPNDLVADKNIAFIALLGSPGKMFEGYGQTAALNAFLEMNTYLTQSGDEPLSYLIPVEMGAINTLIPFIISAHQGVAVINGDPCGRAAPEMSMNLFNIHSLQLNPVILTSDTAPSGRYQKTIVRVYDAEDTENQARKFAKSNNNLAAKACYPMRGSDLNCLSAPNRAKFFQWTVGLAWNLGRNLSKSKNYHEFLGVLNSFTLSSHILFEGRITAKEERNISGFDAGRITVSNEQETIFIYYKNESLLAWNSTRKCLVAMGPDSISFLSLKDAQPLSNADINSNPERNPKNIALGTEIGIIGLCAFEKLQHVKLVDLFLANIQETLTAFPEDRVVIPDSYIPLSSLVADYKR